MTEHEGCTCGVKTTPEEDGCTCQCDACFSYRRAAWKKVRIKSLHERLTKGGIDLEDFSDLIWVVLGQKINERLEKKLTEMLFSARLSIFSLGKFDEDHSP